MPVPDFATLDVLRQYNILDSAPEEGFDGLARLAAQLGRVSVGLIAFLRGDGSAPASEDRYWLKALTGWPENTPCHPLVCLDSTLAAEDGLLVMDLQQDERFVFEPIAVGTPAVRFYAGVPLLSPAGAALGVLAIMGWEPGNPPEGLMEGLRLLARQVIAQLELRRRTAALTEAIAQQHAAETEQKLLFSLSAHLACVMGADGYLKRLNPAWRRLLGYTAAELMAKPFLEFIHPDDWEITRSHIQKVVAKGKKVTFQNRCRHRDGTYHRLQWRIGPLPDRQLLCATASEVSADAPPDPKPPQYDLLADLAFALNHHSMPPLPTPRARSSTPTTNSAKSPGILARNSLGRIIGSLALAITRGSFFAICGRRSPLATCGAAKSAIGLRIIFSTGWIRPSCPSSTTQASPSAISPCEPTSPSAKKPNRNSKRDRTWQNWAQLSA
jgi:PAS domain S-box